MFLNLINMWTLVIILCVLDIIACILLVFILYRSGKDRYVPPLNDEEYKEFMEWINKKKNKEKWKK